MKTVPIQADRDRTFQELVNTCIRQLTAERMHPTRERNGESYQENYEQSQSNGYRSIRDGSGVTFLNNLKHSSTKAADGLGKVGKGLFGKITRNSGTNEKEVILDENYQCKVINLPLVEQTRLTRIS